MFNAPPVIKAEVFARRLDALRARDNPRQQNGVARDCLLDGKTLFGRI